MCLSVVNLASELIKIPSISPLDLGCQNILAKRLINLGFIVEYFNINDTKNIWAYRKGINSGKHLNFLGHTDVVPVGIKKKWKYDPFNPVIANGYLFGRGSCDMKGALASMIIAVENFIIKKPNYFGKLSFLITSDEESTGINGINKVVKILLSRNEKIDYCIVGEPTSKKNIGDIVKIGRRGSITFSIIIRGISGHVAYPEFVINPIHIISKSLLKLINYSWDSGNNYFPPTSCQITKIVSNSQSSNVVPDQVLLEFNIRFSNELNPKKIKFIIKKIFDSNILNYSMKYTINAVPYLTKKCSLIKVVTNSIKKYFNIKTLLSTCGGTSDGRFMTVLTKQIIELGLVNKTIHKYNECTKISDLNILSSMYKKIIKKLLI